jgi:hypothetical protein
MSAEERLLLMRKRRWSFDGGAKAQGELKQRSRRKKETESWSVAGVDDPESGSTSRGCAEKAFGENDVQQKLTIPFGVNRGTESGKSGKRTNDWSLFKRKGWELIHKAESINYVRT